MKTLLKEAMDRAITEYIKACTDTDGTDADYSAINEEIDNAIESLGGTPAGEPY